MIAELRVRDLATIADVTLQLGEGLNVLSGETGAGKSMLVDALALLLGERAESGLVRPGAGRAVAEGVFDVKGAAARQRVEDLGLDLDEGRLVIRREVSAEGRSRAWVNGSPTTIGVLAQIGSLLVDLHGQHESQSLLKSDAQRDILDAFAGAHGERAAVAETFGALTELQRNERELIAWREDVRRRADYLRHVVAEIDRARLKPGEDEQVDLQVRRLAQAETLLGHAARIAATTGTDEAGAQAALSQASRALLALERVDPSVAAWRDLLDSATANLDELNRLASEYGDSLQGDPERLAELERRRDLLFTLMQKHGATLAEVIHTREAAAAELDLLDTADLDLRAIAARRSAASAALDAAVAARSARRREAADGLVRAVNRWLPKLGLPGGRLAVQLEALATPSLFGAESVSFTVRLNEGLDPRPLAQVASGGELSRLMLALKVVLARHDAVDTLVFDEVDAGIGGEIGAQVGDALASVADKHQVLVLTHLPQIAARADRHLVVAKEKRGGIATSDVRPIFGEDRVSELARMLGDAEGETARKHAAKLLQGAKESVKGKR